MQVRSLGWEDPLEEEMATHSSILAWKTPRAEEPGRLQFMGSQRLGHDWACTHAGRAISSRPSVHVQLQLATEYAHVPPCTWTDMDSKCPRSGISGTQREETTCPKPGHQQALPLVLLSPLAAITVLSGKAQLPQFDSHLQAFLHSHSHFCEPQLLVSLLPFICIRGSITPWAESPLSSRLDQTCK